MNIEKVAVIGAGIMGSAIAAHITNAAVPVILLDIVSDQDQNRNAIAEQAIARLLKTQPPPFMIAKNAHLIRPGNIEDDLSGLDEVDWIIEAVIEKKAVKQALYQKLTAVCRPDTLISSNTSTLPLSVLAKGQTAEFKRRFMITHFFNPPRYMRLLELVTADEFDPDLLQVITGFCDIRLGKGCVHCKDTPGFIANRIGTFWLQSAVKEAIRLQLPIEHCDAAMTLFGLPKTGIFGLLDLIGLDLMPAVLGSFKQALPPEDALAGIAVVPEILQTLIDQGYTGRKGKGGFYRLQPGDSARIKQAFDFKKQKYRPSERSLIQGKTHFSDDLRSFLEGTGDVNRFAWKVWSDTFNYAAALIPEIADDIATIDRAMRLGFNWHYGPFELLDQLGIEWYTRKQNPDTLPPLLRSTEPFYRTGAGIRQFRNAENRYFPIQHPPGVLSLNDIKGRSSVLLENDSASLWDIGHGIVCLEFHSKMNTLNPDILELILQSIEKIRTDFQGLVIYNESEHFSAGANLNILVRAIAHNNWETVESIIRLGQNTFHALKYAPFPVVAAPSGLALGGGCEILLHCDGIQAHAELYTGLVETRVGLLPGWGGCKELLRRWLTNPECPGGPVPPIAQTFETIALAKVSNSAQDAKTLLFLSKDDGITMNRNRLLADAKTRVQSLINNYHPPEKPVYFLAGKSAWSALDIAVHNLHVSAKVSAYDVVISRQLATVLSGGETDTSEALKEQDLLDLELKAFLYLVQQPATQDRLEYMLKTGKPLRN